MILPSLATLEEFSNLVPWLLAGDWRESASDRPGPESLPTCQSIRVTDDDEANFHDCDILIVGGFSPISSRLGESLVLLNFTYDKSTRSQKLRMRRSCWCPGVERCVHGTAILETLAKIASEGEPASQIPPNVPQTNQLGMKTLQWLVSVKTAAGPASRREVESSPRSKFLAYCIESQHDVFRMGHKTLQLTLRVGSQQESGMAIEAGKANADPFNPPKYMADEDIPICTHLHNRARKYASQVSAMRLRGGDWEQILPPALDAGRLIFGNPAAAGKTSSDYRVITAGDAVPVETGWDIAPDGNAFPVLKLPSESMLPILTDPLRYLDTATCRMGLMTTRLSHSMIQVWSDGPRVPAEEIEAVSREIGKICSETPLAIPSDKPARQVIGHGPIPHLEITEVATGPFLKRHLGGIVTFRYPDLPPVLPIVANVTSTQIWLDEGNRVVLERDKASESARLEELREHRLIPLKDLLPAVDLTDKTRNTVALETIHAGTDDWLAFMEGQHCADLRANGWVIEAHKKAGLIVHDIRDFFPLIATDATQEIDWFRFDVTAEFDGKTISLIPQIARAFRDDLHLRYPDPEQIPETLLLACDKPSDGHFRFPARRFLAMLDQVRHLFQGPLLADGRIHLDRIGAARIADVMEIDDSETTLSLAELGRNLRDVHGLPTTTLPKSVKAELRPYQLDGFRWLQFLKTHGLHGILADDMGLGKTLQTLSHLAAEHPPKRVKGSKPSLVIAPTSVVPNWAAEAAKFTPHLKTLVLHGSERSESYAKIPRVDVVFTSYPLLARDIEILTVQVWHSVVLDEAHTIKNPRSITARSACQLRADHRICLSGTPMENHLGELWSLMRFLMPGYLGDEKSFNTQVRKPIEKEKSSGTQLALNRRISPLILRRTKDQVATELPAKTTLIHRVDLTAKQSDLYESIRAAMDDRVRHAIAEKGIAKSHIIVLDALLKLRQICCHPSLLGSEASRHVSESAKFDYLTQELLPTLLEEGRRILIFSQFTTMLGLIEAHLVKKKIPYLQLTGQTKERASLVRDFQSSSIPVFLISLKAGGTGLNLTAADTIIHYDPWWNPAAENQATDRAHRIGQTKPVFVHKLVCTNTIEERILELQIRKDKLVKALLSEENSALKIDSETLSHLLAPL